MKKNLVIVVLFLAVAGLLGWQICPSCIPSTTIQEPEASVSSEPAISVDEAGLEELKVEIVSSQEPALVAPVSEVDQKLNDLGFGTSAETHNLVVK